MDWLHVAADARAHAFARAKALMHGDTGAAGKLKTRHVRLEGIPAATIDFMTVSVKTPTEYDWREVSSR
jgi:hypothetical protein